MRLRRFPVLSWAPLLCSIFVGGVSVVGGLSELRGEESTAASGAAQAPGEVTVGDQTLEAAEARQVVEKWLEGQRGVKTLQVDFVQTRRLRTLKLPIRKEGVLWLDYGAGRFRWELGKPPQTIVVGGREALLIVRPGSKQFERRDATGEGGGGAPPEFASLTRGFPRDLQAFEEAYHLIDVRLDKEGRYAIRTRPAASGSGAEGIQALTFSVEKERSILTGIEITLADGSQIGTRFTRLVRNADLPADLFSPEIDGYRETEFSRRD